jgi:putative transposase
VCSTSTSNIVPDCCQITVPAFVSDALKKYLRHYQMEHVRGAPCHLQTQGKIERCHRSMKSVVKLDVYYSPAELEQAIANFVYYYNYQRYHESLGNVTPADMYFGRYTTVTTQRERIKQRTLQQRCEHYLQAVCYSG